MVNLNSIEKYHIVGLKQYDDGRLKEPRPEGCQHSRDSLANMLAYEDCVSIDSLSPESVAVIATHTCSKCGLPECMMEKLPDNTRSVNTANPEYWEEVGLDCPACGETPDRVDGNTFYHNSFEEGMTKCKCYSPTFESWLKNPDHIQPSNEQCSTTEMEEKAHGRWWPVNK